MAPFWCQAKRVDARVKLCAVLSVHHPSPFFSFPLPPSLSLSSDDPFTEFILGRVTGLLWAPIDSRGANRLLRLAAVLSPRDWTWGVGPAFALLSGWGQGGKGGGPSHLTFIDRYGLGTFRATYP